MHAFEISTPAGVLSLLSEDVNCTHDWHAALGAACPQKVRVVKLHVVVDLRWTNDLPV